MIRIKGYFTFSTNEEAYGRNVDNELTIRVPVEIKAQLSLVGRSTPEQLDYSIRNRTPSDPIFDSEIGPVVSHLYQVYGLFKICFNFCLILSSHKYIQWIKKSMKLFYYPKLLNTQKKFQVINRGPSAISGASLDIIWPSFAENGKHLLYLIDEPQVNDANKVKCRVKQAENINPDSLTVIIFFISF